MVSQPLRWRFNERQPGEPIRGGVNAFAFKINLNTLVREALQNVNDQRIGDVVEAEFVLQTYSGSDLPRLLELLGWNSGLEQHLQVIASSRSHLTGRARRTLEAVEEQRVRVLAIRDFGARGLNGPEDGSDGNFVSLCRHELTTDENQKKLRGGAFGLGKSVLWAFSSASTVLFSSLPSPERGTRPLADDARFFGRSYLVSHKMKGATWHNGDGHFGHGQLEKNGFEWTVSVRGDDARRAVRSSILERDVARTGTSILIPFFDDPGLDKQKPDGEVLADIRKAAGLWFWPSMEEGFLRIRVGTRTGTNEQLEEIAVPDWVSLYRRAKTDGRGVPKVREDGGSANAEIFVEVKRRLEEPKRAKARASALLAVTRLTEDEADGGTVPPEVRNSIAFVRGARMVVQYFTGSLSNLLPDFVGVLVAGYAHGDSEADAALDAFLRDSEPPAHDRWDPEFEKLRNYDHGARSKLKSFLEDVGTRTRDLLGMKSTESRQKPRELADMLRGGKGKTTPRVEAYELLEKTVDRREPSLIRATLRVRRNRGTGQWWTRIRVGVLDEQGTMRALDVVDGSVRLLRPLGTVARILPDDCKTVEVSCGSDVEEFFIECHGSVGTSNIAKRSMADVHIRYGNRT